jgi:hypothetical protein
MRAPGTKTGSGKETQASVAVESAERPGYTRKPNGEHFEYLDTEGKRIRDEQRLIRIKRLAIPPMFGFAHRRMATFRRRVATHAGGSSTVTMSVGARFVTKINSAVSQILPKRFPGFESDSIATSNCLACRAEKCSQLL